MDLTPASRAQLSHHHRHLSHLPARPSTAQACRTQRQNLDCIKLLITPKETAQLGGENGRVTSGGRPVPLICSATSRLAAGGTVLAYAPEDVSGHNIGLLSSYHPWPPVAALATPPVLCLLLYCLSVCVCVCAPSSLSPS
jgi:hypothetical protein